MTIQTILKEYLETHLMTAVYFAAMCDLCNTTIYAALNHGKLSAYACRKILIGTDGKINLGIPYKSSIWYKKKLTTIEGHLYVDSEKKPNTRNCSVVRN